MKMHLKISHRGQMRFFSCPLGTTYEEIMQLAIDRFAINKRDNTSNMLLLTTEHGYVFDKLLFEYFILLFPRPEIAFYLRVDYKQLAVAAADGGVTSPPASRQPFGVSQAANGNNNNKRRRPQADEEAAGRSDGEEDCDDDGDDDVTYEPVAVYRQNCFLGELPSQTAAALERQQQLQFSVQLRRRLRQLEAATPALQKTRKRCLAGRPPAAKRLRV